MSAAPENPFGPLCRIALARGEAPIYGTVWECIIPDPDGRETPRWRCRVNATGDTVDAIPPYHVGVEWYGWPAGLLHLVAGGILAAGSEANIDTLMADLNALADEVEAACN